METIFQINKLNNRNVWDHENGFYWFGKKDRLIKIIAHYEFLKKISNLKGDILEFGVCRGSSLIRFLTFLEILKSTKKVIAFDTFGDFPNKKLSLESDINFAKKFNINCKALSEKKINKILRLKKLKNYLLIKGNVFDTLPKYINKNKGFFSLILLDLDVKEPTTFVLENLYKRLLKNGIIILDNYGVVAGETLAVDVFIKKNKLKINLLEGFSNFYYLQKK